MRIARRALEAGRLDDGLAALASAAAAERGSNAIEEHLDLLALSSPSDALARVDELLREYPDDASLVLRKAQLTAHLSGASAARAVVVEALPRMRDNERLAAYAEELGVEPPWLSRLQLGDDVIRARREASEPPFPGYPAVALLDDVERDVYEDDGSLVVRHLVIELRSKDVLDRFGEISTGDGRVVRLRVLKPDGSIVERERHRGVDDVSLPQLSPGDIVELLTVDARSAHARRWDVRDACARWRPYAGALAALHAQLSRGVGRRAAPRGHRRERPRRAAARGARRRRGPQARSLVLRRHGRRREPQRAVLA